MGMDGNDIAKDLLFCKKIIVRTCSKSLILFGCIMSKFSRIHCYSYGWCMHNVDCMQVLFLGNLRPTLIETFSMLAT